MADNSRSFGGQDVAVFIDFENIYISVLAEYDVNPDFEAIIEKAEEFGRVSVAQAYADWTPYSHYINSLHAYQIDPIYVPAYHYGEGGKQKGGAIKNSVDMFLCINAMKMLYSHPNIQTFVLITGDRDFVPLIKTIREFGKRTVVIGVAGAASAHLAQAADEFFFYHQITDNLKPPEKEKTKSRDPYDTLVEAVRLARQRGYVATLASLKLLMSELMGDFDESRYKDNRGKPLQKFKDFVKEAERRGKVKLFSTGTINEVFLPNEDPRKASRFVEEVLAPEPPAESQEPTEAEEEAEVDVEVSREQWALFCNTMSQIEGAVPFVRVFDALRGLRNQGLLDLSNKELKAMIIKAIHMKLLNRSNRGRSRRTFYQLTNDPAVLGQYIEVTAANGTTTTPEDAAEEPEAIEAAPDATKPASEVEQPRLQEAANGLAAASVEPLTTETVPTAGVDLRFASEPLTAIPTADMTPPVTSESEAAHLEPLVPSEEIAAPTPRDESPQPDGESQPSPQTQGAVTQPIEEQSHI